MASCRACQAPLSYTWVDLGNTPIMNAPLLSPQVPDIVRPLKVMVCEQCWLVQTVDGSPAHTFQSVLYDTVSSSLPSGCDDRFVQRTIQRLQLNESSLVLDISPLDKEVLYHFKRHNIPVMGIGSIEYPAQHSFPNGIAMERMNWNRTTAATLKQRSILPDLIIASHLLPFARDLHETIGACADLLPEYGNLVIEFPHVASLMDFGQFDAIDHEHLSYLSLTSLMPLFLHYGLVVSDAETLPLNGGSLRIWLKHSAASTLDDISAMRVAGILAQEWSTPLDDIQGYQGFQQRVNRLIEDIRTFLITAKVQGKKVVGFGATSKGNTLLNAAKIGVDELSYVVDRIASKQGCWLPGSHIPIKDPAQLLQDKPDYLLILPWHQKEEIWEEWGDTFRKWGGQAVVAIPKLETLG